MSTSINLSSIIDDRSAIFHAINSAGDGFSPNITDAWTLQHAAGSTSDVAVYTDADGRLVLVGTDGMGTDESRWAVRPE